MKTLHTEKYYMDQWEEMARKYTKNDPFADLELLMKGYREVLPEQAVAVIETIEAKKVYDYIKNVLIGTMHTIKAIREGKANLGYTSHCQEVKEWHRIQEEFEFSCVRLSNFRKQYLDA